MKNSTIIRVFFLGVLSIIGIIGMQSYWVINTWNVNEEEFNLKVYRSLYEVAKSLADYNETPLPQQNIINQRSSNYFIVNIESEIDANILEVFLQRELEANALNIDFEYAVFDCNTDKMVYGSYRSFSSEPQEGVELGNLPKYDEFTYYFGVKFPTRPSYLFSKMQMSIFFSILLFLAILFFGYSMYTILKQRQLSRLQKDFINNMTHEFKTPISTIKISAGVFLNNPGIQQDSRLWKYANIIRTQNERLNKQVEKVLQLAKIERGNFEIKPENLNLKEVLKTVEQSASLQIEKRNGILKKNLRDADTNVWADRMHLTNLIHNLLDNAVKYSKGAPQIHLSVRRQENSLNISVSDQGVGISKEYQNKVFDKFFRVPTGNVHQVKGFGIGLYYVKKICDAHRWQLQMESEADKGTTVTVSIPTRSFSKIRFKSLFKKDI